MNFDYIRLFLAVVVMFWHYDVPFKEVWPIFNGVTGVLFFFCISGYLITQSYMRDSNLETYFKKRMLRIYPPIILLCLAGTIAGIIVEREGAYFISMLRYLVFQDCSLTNDSLFKVTPFWTLVVESQFYLAVPIVAYFAKKNEKFTFRAMIFFYLLGSLVLMPEIFRGDLEMSSNRANRVVVFDFAQYFLAGAAFAVYKLHERKDFKAWSIAAFIFVIVTSAEWFPHAKILKVMIRLVSPFAFTCVILAAAKFLGRFGKRAPFGDLSYGIYLYHFPLLQLFEFLEIGHEKIALILLCFVLAFGSWHLVEKRILVRKT